MLHSHNRFGRATKVGIALVLAGLSLTATAQSRQERVALREKARSILVNNGFVCTGVDYAVTRDNGAIDAWCKIKRGSLAMYTISPVANNTKAYHILVVQRAELKVQARL